MTSYEAPAKLNLSLLVSPPQANGYHPLQSLVQTVEWCDLLDVERGEGSDTLESDIEDNVIEKALEMLRESVQVPPLALTLHKEIPVAAGLGGGSSDAAAVLVAGVGMAQAPSGDLGEVAARVGADVSLFLTGGTLMMSGLGERVERLPPAEGFAVGIVVPEFGISTREAYERWDRLEGPEGDAVPDDLLPPTLRGLIPMRNDLLPAALDLEPRLGDFMADVRIAWDTPVCLTGSGSACFSYFATVEEASDAVAAVSRLTGAGRGVALRRRGVTRSSQR